MKIKILSLLACLVLFACKKENDTKPIPQKTWADVKSIKVENARLVNLNYLLASDSLLFTFVVPGSQFDVVSKWTGNTTTFPFTPFSIGKNDPFSIYLEKSDCSPFFDDPSCPQDDITTFPMELGDSLATPWVLVLDDSSQINLTVTYIF